MYKYLLLIFLFGRLADSQAASSLSQQPSCVIAQEAPCSFVNDTVNVIGGNFCLQFHHLKVPGHVPLDLVQYYNNKSSYSSWVGTGMTLNYGFLIQGKEYADKKHDKYGKYAALNVELPGGSIVPCIAKEKPYGTSYYHLDPEVVHESLTNCGGQMSARNNLKNIEIKQVVKSAKQGLYADWSCTFPDGSLKKYRRTQKKESVMTVLHEEKLNKTKIDYKYRKYFSGERKIKEIRARVKNEMNWLFFKDGYKKSYIKTSNGKKASFYTFGRKGQKYIYKIKSTDTPTVDLHYIHDGDKSYIDRVSWPNGRFLEVEYDKKARVIAQKAPVGRDGVKHSIWNFEYHKDNTVVTDANGGKKIFFHKNGRIRTVDEYKSSNLYRTTAYYWGKKAGYSWDKKPHGDEGHLMATVTLDDQRNTAGMLQYKYDKYGNILEEVTLGNLSGKNTSYFKLSENGTLDDLSVEKYRKYYTYSDKHLVLTQSEDSGPHVEYRYKNGTDIVWAKFTRDNGTIILREFYEHDDNGIVKEKIIDNGSTDNKSCLTGVTQRLITHIRPVSNKKGYSHGLPQDIWENYYDLKNNKVTLLKHTEFKYNKAGDVIEEKVKDAKDQECFTNKYAYDHKGRLHKKTNALGQVFTYVYDDNDNKTYEKQEDAKFHTIYEYDLSNRCVAQIHYHYDGNEDRTMYEYDFMGNKISSTDRYGNKTTFEYDSCNRLITINLPNNEEGESYTIRKEYDVYDNVIKEINQKGAVTTYEYTANKVPCKITYPDGSVEEFEYNLNGTLANKWDKCGIKTSYKYDVLGRTTQISICDEFGKELSTVTNQYNAFHLLSTTDAMGSTIFYKYDEAGRKIEERKESENNYSKTSFHYDTLGRLDAIRKYFGNKGKNYLETKFTYDKLNRIIKEKNSTKRGECTSWKEFEYDAQGQCKLERSSHNHEISEIAKLYNSQRELVELKDEYGNITNVSINHVHSNSSNNKVVLKTTKDALNNITEELYDIFGRVILVTRKNNQFQTTACTELFYNATNQKVKQVEHVYAKGAFHHDYTVTWEYDILDRIVKLVEQPDKPEEKITTYTYDTLGRIITLTKPSGIVINHTYDALGRLCYLKSSDGTVSYKYTYDLNDNPLVVVDDVSCVTSEYSYDAWNRTISDGIKGQIAQAFMYDALGRLTTLTSPDGSIIKYKFMDNNLSTISWKGFKHQYSTFDLQGRPLQSTLIGAAGIHEFIWDKKGRIVDITSAHFTQKIPEDGFDAVGNLKECSLKDSVGEAHLLFAYDDLYHLIEESGVQTHTYENDSIANRCSKDNLSYSTDSANKLLNDSEDEFIYDKNGNLIKQISNSKPIIFTYDALDRLIKVSNGKQETTYFYDHFHRRIARSFNNLPAEYFLYLGQREVGLWDTSNQKIMQYRVLGLGTGAEMGASIAIELSGKIYCPLHDYRGDIVALVEPENGKVAESYRYTAFGECEIYNSQQQRIECTSLNNPWGFASKRCDLETGFMYFSRRYYAPKTGRWTTPDPLGFADGPNMYAYVHGNPATKFDLYGLYVEEGYNPSNWKPYECRNAQVSAAYDRRIEDTYRDLGYLTQGSPFSKNEKNYNSIKLVDRPEHPSISHVYVPGMNTSFVDSIKQGMYLSDLIGGYQVNIVQNFTHGLFYDIPRAIGENIGRFSSEAVHDFRSLLSQNSENPNHRYFVVGFSEGAIITRNGLQLCSDAIKSKSYAVGVCPGSLIPSAVAGSTINIANKSILRDPVPHLNILGGVGYYNGVKYSSNVDYYDSHADAAYFDHDVTSKTYRNPLQTEYSKFITGLE